MIEIIDRKIREMYKMEEEKTEDEETVMHIHEPQYVGIINPEITEDENTIMIASGGGIVTIWKDVKNMHIVLRKEGF